MLLRIKSSEASAAGWLRLGLGPVGSDEEAVEAVLALGFRLAVDAVASVLALGFRLDVDAVSVLAPGFALDEGVEEPVLGPGLALDEGVEEPVLALGLRLDVDAEEPVLALGFAWEEGVEEPLMVGFILALDEGAEEASRRTFNFIREALAGRNVGDWMRGYPMGPF